MITTLTYKNIDSVFTLSEKPIITQSKFVYFFLNYWRYIWKLKRNLIVKTFENNEDNVKKNIKTRKKP